MPFTFSHPAAVLPFNYLPKKWLSLTALVAGSMAPDFEYFIRMKVSAHYSHTWLGLFWFDLPLSLILFLVYNSLVRDKLIDHLPAWLNKRFSGLRTSGGTYFKGSLLVIIISLLIGGATHLFWDSFTHPTGYFVNHIHYLKHKFYVAHYPIETFNILQHLSSLTGLLVIAFAVIQLPAGRLTNTGSILLYWIKIMAVALLVLIIRLFTGLQLQQYGDVIVTGISGMLIGLLVVSVTTRPKQIMQG